MTSIKRGAEAVIRIKNGIVIKDRVKKGYRVEPLDGSLIRGRTRREAKLMALAKRAGVPTPFITDIDMTNGRITMTHIQGETIKDVLNEMSNENRGDICKTIGIQIGKLHRTNVIHGDLTTSNMILCDSRVYFIDFGLGEINESVEAKGVDLLVFKKALHAAHWKIAEECFSKMVEGYSEEYKNADDILKRLRIIERRGRYFKER